jgi:hypothetical protein
LSRPDDSQRSIILDRFDAEWARGAAAEIRDFLPDEADDLAVKTLLIELVMIDLERRWRANTSQVATLLPDAEQFPESPPLEDHLARYGESGAIEALPVKLTREESHDECR